MDRFSGIGKSKAASDSEEVAIKKEFHLDNGELKVKINTLVWENGPGYWTLDEADAVACKMFCVFFDAAEAAKEKP